MFYVWDFLSSNRVYLRPCTGTLGLSTHPVFHSYRINLCIDLYFDTVGDAVSPVLLCVAGEPLYETVKSIPANSELVVYFLPERPEEVFFMPAVHYLRNSLYRRTMDTILEGRAQQRRDLLATVLLHDTVSTAVTYAVGMLCAVRQFTSWDVATCGVR